MTESYVEIGTVVNVEQSINYFDKCSVESGQFRFKAGSCKMLQKPTQVKMQWGLENKSSQSSYQKEYYRRTSSQNSAFVLRVAYSNFLTSRKFLLEITPRTDNNKETLYGAYLKKRYLTTANNFAETAVINVGHG